MTDRKLPEAITKAIDAFADAEFLVGHEDGSADNGGPAPLRSTRANRNTERRALEAAILAALHPAPPVSPAWTVETFGDTGLTQCRIERGWVRATVRYGYDDHQVLASLDDLRHGRVAMIRHSWFGGLPDRQAEAIEEAKAAVLGWAREIGSLAVAEEP